MVSDGNGEKEKMELSLTRERAKAQTIENLITAGVLLRGEAARYEKLLNTYDNTQLTMVMVASHELKEVAGETIT